MASLQNLVPDPTTKNIWVPRPAAEELTDFAGFSAPGFISAKIVVGSLFIGMIASGLNPGKDQPFAFNIVTNAFVTISGITSANTPTSPSSTGAWIPPTMALIGIKVAITHPGYDGTSHFVGWIDVSNPASLSYTAGNTATNVLPSVPVAVAQFTQRAYYICNPVNGQPAILATDVLDPTTRTNGSYTLTFGDNIPLTALAGLPLSNVLGGIIGSLIVFKGNSNMYQITGDFDSTTSPIAQNTLNVATGTNAPNSICTTPLGLAFISPDGLRIISFTAQVSDPIGEPTEKTMPGVVVPFTNAVVPSRIAAACNAKVIRISVQNGAAGGNPVQEWWYDLVRKVWSGPHTFPASLIDVYQDTFVMAPNGIPASLWQSDPEPNLLSSYTENGATLTWTWQTSPLPSRKDMNQCIMNDTTVYIGVANGVGPINAVITDENNSALGAVSLNIANAGTIWGAFLWGAAPWGGASNALAARSLEWINPIEFDRIILTLTGQSGGGVRIGDAYLRYQPLGYLAGSYTGPGA